VLDPHSGYRGLASAKLDQIDEKTKELERPLRNLSEAMRQLERVAAPVANLLGRTKEPDPALVQRWLRQARDRLQECRRNDPLHHEVVKYGQRIKEFEDKYPGA